MTQPDHRGGSARRPVALVAGAAGDIGRAMCRRFHRDGYALACLDVRSEQLVLLSHELEIAPPDIYCAAIDLTEPEAVRSIVDQVAFQMGGIDVLINTAGGNKTLTIADATPATWLADIHLNLNAAFYLAAAVLPHMQRQRKGNVVNIGSVNGLGIYGDPGYSAAKAGLIQFTKQMAVEYGHYGIRANVICPGTVKTQAWERMLAERPEFIEEAARLYPLQGVATPADIAGIAAFLASPDARIITGSVLVADGGLTAGIPGVAQFFTSGKPFLAPACPT
ncbi:SDR family oxidoreductase [Pseudoduganella armeniaca]|nr:SDR family oxidoreductase [Pseudoduganella armeniaca]